MLATPPQAFAKIVPWLISLASLAILIRPDRSRVPFPVGQRPTRALSVGVFLVGVYGGYFGAAAGVILLALLLISTSEVLARSNALKNLLLGLANGIAGLVFVFVFFGPVSWTAVLPLGLGLLIGGRIGPIVVRRAHAVPLRAGIACAGLSLAVSSAIRAYR